MGEAAAAVLLDIDGVLVVSWEAVPGAPEALARLRAQDLPVRFLTNTTSVTVATIAERLRTAGIEVGDDEILTAGLATAAYLDEVHAGARCFVVNDGPRNDLETAGVDWTDDPATAEVIVVGGAGPELSWEQVNLLLRAVVRGAHLVAVHGSRTWQTASGPCLDGGAYVAMLEDAAGVEATVVGKPAPGMFEAALRSIGAVEGAVAMVGDDVDSDVLAAQAAGLRGVLVRTGKFRPPHEQRRDPAPDLVVDSIADVPAALGL